MITNSPDGPTQLEIFRRMALLKANDERSRKVITSGRLVMPYYSYRGQEVIPSALSVNLRDSDYLCTIYRGIHDMLAKGLPLKDLWAEIAGRAAGTCKGKGGPMHLTHPAKGVMVTTGIVGSSMPIANGLAWGAQLLGTDNVAVATFGDGAANIGAFHEALNLAAVWKLPTIFVCQNNRYAEHTAYAKGTSAKQIADRAIAYGMPGVRVDGNDPIAMYAVAREAVERARAGEGPTLIEAASIRSSSSRTATSRTGSWRKRWSTARARFRWRRISTRFWLWCANSPTASPPNRSSRPSKPASKPSWTQLSTLPSIRPSQAWRKSPRTFMELPHEPSCKHGKARNDPRSS
jgi:pyruvate dehydrogenase E1 component alpha subunit